MTDLDAVAANTNTSAVVRKLGACILMSESDVTFVEGLLSNRKKYRKGDYIARTGEPMQHCIAIISGTAIRARTNRRGQRQILDVAVSGDIIGATINYDNRTLFDLVSANRVEAALIEPLQLIDLYRQSPVLAAGMQWNLIEKFNVLSEHNVSLGIRSAEARLLHLLLELWCRYTIVGLADMEGFELPLTQNQLGECCSLTNVYVSRKLRELEDRQLIERTGRYVRFPDFAQAFEFAEFDDDFLQPVPLRDGVFRHLVEVLNVA